MRSVLPFQNKTLQINSVEDISALGKKKQINKPVQKSDNGIKSWRLVKSVVTTVSKPSLLLFPSLWFYDQGSEAIAKHLCCCPSSRLIRVLFLPHQRQAQLSTGRSTLLLQGNTLLPHPNETSSCNRNWSLYIDVKNLRLALKWGQLH